MLGGDKPLLHVVGDAAFYSMDTAALTRVCMDQTLIVPPGAGLLDLLISMLCQIFTISEDEAMAKILQRLLQMTKRDRKLVKALMQVDEAVACLTKDDEQRVRTQQKKSKEHEITVRIFVAEWKAKRRQQREAKKAVAAKGKGRGKGKAAVPPAPPKKKIPEDMEVYSQAEGKLLMPPNARLWKSRSDACWHSRYLEFPEISRAVSRWGHGEALRMVISNAWRWHAVAEGLDVEELPVVGLVLDAEDDDDFVLG